MGQKELKPQGSLRTSAEDAENPQEQVADSAPARRFRLDISAQFLKIQRYLFTIVNIYSL